MLLRRSINLLLAAYCGGLVASYSMLLLTPEAFMSQPLRFFPFKFAAAILIFTLPGVFWVAALYRFFRAYSSKLPAYLMATLIGSATGGAILWCLSPPSLLVYGIGAFFGIVTGTIWAILNQFALPAF